MWIVSCDLLMDVICDRMSHKCCREFEWRMQLLSVTHFLLTNYFLTPSMLDMKEWIGCNALLRLCANCATVWFCQEARIQLPLRLRPSTMSGFDIAPVFHVDSRPRPTDASGASLDDKDASPVAVIAKFSAFLRDFVLDNVHLYRYEQMT